MPGLGRDRGGLRGPWAPVTCAGCTRPGPDSGTLGRGLQHSSAGPASTPETGHPV